MTPRDLPADVQVRPWDDPDAAGITPATTLSRARLHEVSTEAVELGAEATGGIDAGALADDVVHALRRLIRRPPGPVVVLAGEGHAGAVARMVVGELVGEGEDVVLVDLAEAPSAAAVTAALRGAGVLVDGLADRATALPLDAATGAVVRGLTQVGAPLVAIDLPSGIDAVAGMVGEAVSADVTVAAAPLRPGHVAPGTAPFVGDLYLSRPGRPLVRADAQGRPAVWAE